MNNSIKCTNPPAFPICHSIGKRIENINKYIIQNNTRIILH